MIKSFDVQVTGEALQGEGLVRRVNPAAMSPEQRRDLVRAIRSGDVVGLQFKALAFGSGPNLNGARLTPEQVSELATGAAGADLMLDHGYSAAQTVGEVVGAEARDEGGERVLVLDHELTEPAAMEAFIQRRLRRFSVAIDAQGWREGEGGAAWAISPVRLVHNAFVSDPAYQGARVVEHARQEPPKREVKMSDNTQDKAPDQAARVAELEGALAGALAQLDELKARLEQREGEVFGAAFDKAVAQGRVVPTARGQFDTIRKAAGLDAAVALFSAYPEQAALPTKPVGAGADTAAVNKTHNNTNADALARAILRAGGKEMK